MSNNDTTDNKEEKKYVEDLTDVSTNPVNISYTPHAVTHFVRLLQNLLTQNQPEFDPNSNWGFNLYIPPNNPTSGPTRPTITQEFLYDPNNTEGPQGQTLPYAESYFAATNDLSFDRLAVVIDRFAEHRAYQNWGNLLLPIAAHTYPQALNTQAPPAAQAPPVPVVQRIDLTNDDDEEDDDIQDHTSVIQ